MQYDSGTHSWNRFWFAACITAAVAVVAALIVLLAAPDQLFQSSSRPASRSRCHFGWRLDSLNGSGHDPLRHSLPDEVRTRTLDAVRNGTVELRTRVESNVVELVLVPTDGSEPLWIARTGAAA